MQLVVVGHIVQPRHLDAAVGRDRDRFGANVVETQSAPMNKTDRLADLQRDRHRIGFAHLETAAPAGKRGRCALGIDEIDPAVIRKARGGLLEGRMRERHREREHASEHVAEVIGEMVGEFLDELLLRRSRTFTDRAVGILGWGQSLIRGIANA